RVAGVVQLTLRLHQRCARHHRKPREVGRIDPPESFRDVVRRPRDRFLELAAALPIVAVHAALDQPVDGLLVDSACLPGAQVGESLNTSHDSLRSMPRARGNPPDYVRKTHSTAITAMRSLPNECRNCEHRVREQDTERRTEKKKREERTEKSERSTELEQEPRS